MTNKILIKNGSVVLPAEVKRCDVVIESGIISYVGSDRAVDRDAVKIDAKDKYVLPGFVDLHSNGAAGFDCSAGLYNASSGQFDAGEAAIAEGLERALRFFVSKGTTKVALSTVAAPISQLQEVFAHVNAYLSSQPQGGLADVLAGLYIEGSFIKMLQFRGAHNPEHFLLPSVEVIEQLQSAANGLIKVVNVPPEHEAAGLEVIEYLTSNGIVAAAGHTGATAEQFEKAIDKGLSLAIHFLNGPTGSSTKPFRGGGAVEAILSSEEMFLELITDGYHVSPAYVLDTLKRKGFDRTAIVTDSMFLTGLADMKEFEVSSIQGKVSDNGEYLQCVENEGSLFGSVLTMDKAFTNMLNWLTKPMNGIWNAVHPPISFEDALVVTSRMCSLVPAKILGIHQADPSRSKAFACGSIEVGKRADLLVAEIADKDGKYKLSIEKVWAGGSESILNGSAAQRIRQTI